MKLDEDLYRKMMGAGMRRGFAVLILLSIALTLVGVGAFVVGVWTGDPKRIWMAYLVNYVFWSGLAFGAVCFIVILNLTKAKWGRPLKRLAEAMGAFLPFSFLLFWLLFWGHKHIFPWLHMQLRGGKGVWLNIPFLFAREGVGLLLLTLTSMALLYYSLKGDVRIARRHAAEQNQSGTATNPEDLLSDPSFERNWRAQFLLSKVFLTLYILELTLFSWDFIMSLEPEWVSTLFGPYYFTGCIYAAAAALFVLAVLGRKGMGLDPFLRPKHFHDLGKFLLGFLLVTGDFFFSQLLLIWYGNLPDETRFLVLRLGLHPWSFVAWAVLGAVFVVPLVVLVIRKIKMMPLPMLALSVLILAGMWLERFLLIAPSLWKIDVIPLGVPEALIALGFLGLTSFCALVYLRAFPVLPLSDPLFRESLKTIESVPR